MYQISLFDNSSNDLEVDRLRSVIIDLRSYLLTNINTLHDICGSFTSVGQYVYSDILQYLDNLLTKNNL